MVEAFKLVDISFIDAGALIWFVLGWSTYAFFADGHQQGKINLVSVMHGYRLNWMKEALHRDMRIADASILSTLIRSVSLFASTAIFIIGGIIAIFGSLDTVQKLSDNLVFVADSSRQLWEVKLLTLAVIFVYAFFKFAWALRQFNYMLTVVGSFPAPDKAETPEAQKLAEIAARMNSLAVNTFNQGMRAYYFGLAALSWFVHPAAFICSTLLVILVVYRREFKSKTLQTLDLNREMPKL